MSEPRFRVAPNSPTVVQELKNPSFWGWVASCKDGQEANAYCDWRNNPTPAPKFKAGDRVSDDDGHSHTISHVLVLTEIEYTVTGGGRLSKLREWKLISPEPVKLKWAVARSGRYWDVQRGPSLSISTHSDDFAGSLLSESLAIQVRDLLNAQEEAEG